MAYGPNGERISQVNGCVEHAGRYHLSRSEAVDIVEHHMDVIRSEWAEVCYMAGLTSAEREQLWERQFLNPFSTGR